MFGSNMKNIRFSRTLPEKFQTAPLVSFTSEQVSVAFYNMPERRAGLKMEPEPGN
jgi:hypothetical protein